MGGGLLRGASTASGPGEPSACGPRFASAGTHLRQKQGGRIWKGVPVLTTYTPPARGLGGFPVAVLTGCMEWVGGGELFVFGLTGAVSREIHSLSRRQAKSLCKAAGRL